MLRTRIRTPAGRALWVAAALGVLATSCDEVVVEPVPVSTVTVDPAAVTLDIGATRRFQATATDAGGNALPRPTTWSSGNSAIATVDEEGLVTAMGEGTVTISATMGSVRGTATVDVFPGPVVALDPVFVTLSARRGGPRSESADVAVTNTGGGSLTGLSTTVQYDDAGSGWLETAFEESTAPTTLQLRGDPQGLAAGTYSAQVTVSGDAPVVEALLTVTFQVVSSAPSRPDDLVADAESATAIRLDWTDTSDNEETFRVERRSSILDPYSEVARVDADVTTYTDASLAPATAYAYRIRACNAVGCSDYEGPVVATTLAGQQSPPPPDGLTATALSSSEVRLEWNDNASDEDAFRIQRRRASEDDFVEAGEAGADETSFDDNGLTDGVTYVYRVQACNEAGCSSFTDEVNVTTPTASAPPPPGDLTAEGISEDEIRLEWRDESNNETRFEIQRRRGRGGSFNDIATVDADETSYVDSGLDDDQRYTYRIRACNAAGCSGFSNQAEARTHDD